MAIVFDAAGSASTAPGSVISWAHTVGGANTLLLVGLECNAASGTLTSMKYAGVAMTKIIGTITGGNYNNELWYLVSPTNGLGTINGTIGANAGTLVAASVSLNNVDQTTPIVGSTAGLFGPVASGSLTRTITANNWFVGEIGYNDQIGTSDSTTGQIRRSSINSGAVNIIIFDTNSQRGTLRWTFPASLGGITAAEINAVPSAGTNLIQSAGTSGAGTVSASWLSNTTTGNMIVVGVSQTSAATLGTVNSITDTQSNTYVKAGNAAGTGAIVIGCELWYARNITGGAGSVTVNNSANNNTAIYVREYSGLYNFLDTAGSAVGSSAAVNTGATGVPTQNNELVVVATADAFGGTQSYTAAGNYGDIVGTTTTSTGVSMEDNIINTGGAQTGTATLTVAQSWACVCVAFRRMANPRYMPQGMGGQ